MSPPDSPCRTLVTHCFVFRTLNVSLTCTGRRQGALYIEKVLYKEKAQHKYLMIDHTTVNRVKGSSTFSSQRSNSTRNTWGPCCKAELGRPTSQSKSPLLCSMSYGVGTCCHLRHHLPSFPNTTPLSIWACFNEIMCVPCF